MRPFHMIGDLLRNVLMSVPMGLVRALFVGLLIGLIIWVLSLSSSRTLPPVEMRAGRSCRWTENLKVWAILALAIQLAIYLFV